jgi:hypothetical protein
MTANRHVTGAIALLAGLLLTALSAAAFDDSKYPDWNGQWKRARGTVNSWDESKRPGHDQNPPLTAQYRALWEASMADQAAGGQGLDTRVTCVSNGMPRLMTILRQLEIFIRPELTLVVFENNLPRRIYTDGRNFSAKDNVPSYAGYSIGKWLDTDGDGKYDTLEVETRNFKGPRNYEPSGIPLHEDNESIIKERLALDKANPDVLRNEITVIDHALTKPWTVVKNYRRERDVEWYEDLCSENNNHVVIGKENYFMSADGYLMPARKDQPPPDLRYFRQTKQ